MSRQNQFAAALLSPAAPCPTGLFAWNGSDPTRRFAVYRNNVTSSLVDALADTFPVVQALVGEEFFRAMARLFVQEHPPRSPILAQYGEHFAEFVEQFAPAQTLPYLADVARLEMARVRAYHAADASPIAPEGLALALAQPDQLECLRVQLLPSLQVLRSPWAVLSIWAAHQTEDAVDLTVLDLAEPEDVLVLRSGWEVQISRLPGRAANFVLGLRRGDTLGCAAQQAMQNAPDFDLTQTLALLLRLNAVVGLAA